MMPIKAEHRAKYPKEWRLISTLIRKYRALDLCECRGECGHDHEAENAPWITGHIRRCLAGNDYPHPVTKSRVVLTVAHLDHDPTHNTEANLRALCQRCHLAYDAKHHRAEAHKTRRARKALGELI